MPHTQGLIGTYRQFWEDEPDETSGSGSLWYHRTQNSVIAYLEGPAGSRLVRTANPDEYFVFAFFHRVRVTAGGETIEGGPGSIFIVPPGDSQVELLDEGSVWAAFTASATDLLDRCPNKDEYEPALANIAPITPMGEPEGGFALRHYVLSTGPDGPRCFVHRTAMAKFRWPYRSQPRDPEKMSPHDHEDFEQASLILQGTMVHHMRRHWTRNSREWMPDEHQTVVAPAVAISKPPDIHTTQAVTRGALVGLIDLYSPVRWDILTTGGMITNEGIYPPPEKIPEPLVTQDFIYEADDPRRALETGGRRD
jgi:quercetin dioxygenase-like cupin family protein